MLQGRLFISKNLNHGWKKKVSKKDFYVAMGCYDGEEICELVGFHSQPTRNFSQNFKTNDRKKRKTNCYDLQCGLAITTECNLKTVNLLDITVDLQNNVYKPYHKANASLHILTNSNHPPSNKIYWKKTGRNITNT